MNWSGFSQMTTLCTLTVQLFCTFKRFSKIQYKLSTINKNDKLISKSMNLAVNNTGTHQYNTTKVTFMENIKSFTFCE